MTRKKLVRRASAIFFTRLDTAAAVIALYVTLYVELPKIATTANGRRLDTCARSFPSRVKLIGGSQYYYY